MTHAAPQLMEFHPLTGKSDVWSLDIATPLTQAAQTESFLTATHRSHISLSARIYTDWYTFMKCQVINKITPNHLNPRSNIIVPSAREHNQPELCSHKSPLYNHTGWLGIKQPVTYLLFLLTYNCVSLKHWSHWKWKLHFSWLPCQTLTIVDWWRLFQSSYCHSYCPRVLHTTLIFTAVSLALRLLQSLCQGKFHC